MAEDRQIKRSSVASTTPSLPRSRPHSAAELYYPALQGTPDPPPLSRVSSAREGGPRIIDASQHALNVEDEPIHRGSSRGKNRASYQSMSGGSTSGAPVDPGYRRSSWRNSASRQQQPLLDEYTLDEHPGLGNLTEVTAPAPLPERYGEDDLYRDDSLLRPTSGHASKRGGRGSNRSSYQRPLSSDTGRQATRHSHRSSVPAHPHDERDEDATLIESQMAAPQPTFSRSAGRFTENSLDGSLGHRRDRDDEEGHTWQDREGEVDDEKAPPFVPQTPLEKTMQHVFTLSHLVFFSILGVLARLGLQWLTFYPGTPIITPVLWANFAGSLFMGVLTEDRMLFRHTPHRPSLTSSSRRTGGLQRLSVMDPDRFANFLQAKKKIPLYVGLTTGFCGTLTSFSSFIRDTFLALSNDLPAPYNEPPTSYNSGAGPANFHASGSATGREGGYSFMALSAVIIATVGLSIAALKIGGHMALALERVPFYGPLSPNFLFTGRSRQVLDWIMPVLAIGSWLGAVFMAIWPPDRPGAPSSRGSWDNETWRGEAIFACVFAPLGCLVRYYASGYMNPLQPAFPLGTFACNVFGTAVEGMAWDIQHVPLSGAMRLVGGGRVGCQVLQGLMDGFCGALTTVSTWVVELNSLKKRHAWTYGFMSVGVGLALWVIIVGSVRWTIGFSPVACVT